MGRPRKVTNIQIEEMKKLDAEGLTRAAIAERFSIDPSRVSQLLGKKLKKDETRTDPIAG